MALRFSDRKRRASDRLLGRRVLLAAGSFGVSGDGFGPTLTAMTLSLDGGDGPPVFRSEAESLGPAPRQTGPPRRRVLRRFGGRVRANPDGHDLVFRRWRWPSGLHRGRGSPLFFARDGGFRRFQLGRGRLGSRDRGAEDIARREPEIRPDLSLDLGCHIRVLAEELLGVLPALPDAEVAVAEPRAGLLDDLHLETDVDQLARLRDSLPEGDVELGDAERGRDLVFHDLDLRAIADDDLAVLDRVDAPDVDAHGRIELQGAAAGRRLGVPEHDADLFADLVDEDERGFRLRDDGREFAQRLRHEARLQTHRCVAHLALELGFRDERGDGVDDDDVDRGRAHEGLGDLERLLAGVGLRDHEVVDVDAELPGVIGVEGVLGVDERREPAVLLRLRNDVQGQGGLARGLGPEDFDDSAPGDASDPERRVHADRAGGDGLDDFMGLVTEADERAFPELLVDLLDGDLERLELFLVHFDHVVSFKRGGL